MYSTYILMNQISSDIKDKLVIDIRPGYSLLKSHILCVKIILRSHSVATSLSINKRIFLLQHLTNIDLNNTQYSTGQ